MTRLNIASEDEWGEVTVFSLIRQGVLTFYSLIVVIWLFLVILKPDRVQLVRN